MKFYFVVSRFKDNYFTCVIINYTEASEPSYIKVNHFFSKNSKFQESFIALIELRESGESFK